MLKYEYNSRNVLACALCVLNITGSHSVEKLPTEAGSDQNLLVLVEVI